MLSWSMLKFRSFTDKFMVTTTIISDAMSGWSGGA